MAMQTEQTKKFEVSFLLGQQYGCMWNYTLLSFCRKKYFLVSDAMLKSVRKVFIKLPALTLFDIPPVVCDT